MCPHKIRDGRGFTLAEMILATLIVSFLGAALYASFAQGMRIWRYAAADRMDWKAGIFLDQLSGELRNMIFFDAPSFTGTADSIMFYTLVPQKAPASQMSQDEEAAAPKTLRAPGRVQYRFNRESKIIERQRQEYHEILNRENFGSGDPVFEDVEGLHFEFYDATDKAAAFWRTDWNKDACLPKAVKIQIEGREGKAVKPFSRIVRLPLLKPCAAEEKTV